MNDQIIPETVFVQPSVTQPAQMSTSGDADSSLDFMMFLRIIFYIIVALKIIEISFLRRKKLSLKERIYKKFIFAHNQLLRHFTDEDKTNMEITLTNTIKNAVVQLDPKNSKMRHTSKKVSFNIISNNYYEPKIWKEDDYYFDKNTITSFLDKRIDDNTFQEKKMEEQFIERQDLLDINEKSDQLSGNNSKLTQQTKSSQINQHEQHHDQEEPLIKFKQVHEDIN